MSVKHHVALLDGPVHPGSLQPGVERLLRGQYIAETVPRRLAGVGHGVDEMSHIKISNEKGAAKAAPEGVHGDNICLRFF